MVNYTAKYTKIKTGYMGSGGMPGNVERRTQ
jgi:hypothetical protein